MDINNKGVSKYMFVFWTQNVSKTWVLHIHTVMQNNILANFYEGQYLLNTDYCNFQIQTQLFLLTYKVLW